MYVYVHVETILLYYCGKTSIHKHTQHTFIDLPAALSKQHCKEWVVLLFLNSSARARNLVLCIACTHNPKSRHPKPEKEQTIQTP